MVKKNYKSNIIPSLSLIIMAICSIIICYKLFASENNITFESENINLNTEQLEKTLQTGLNNMTEKISQVEKPLQTGLNNMTEKISQVEKPLNQMASFHTKGYNIEALAKDITFENVEDMLSLDQLIGLDREKAALTEFQTCINNLRTIETTFQQKRPTGIIFHGCPGTGKTSLARALAKTAGCAYIEIDGTDFQKYSREEGPCRVDALFHKVREDKDHERIIVCIDECENTWGNLTKAENQATKNIVTKFKNKFTGIHANSGPMVFWIGTTNHVDELDSAIVSRFEHIIEVKYLETQARQQLFRHKLNKIQTNAITPEACNYIINVLAVDIEQHDDLKSIREIEKFIRGCSIRAVSQNNTNPVISQDIVKSVFDEKVKDIEDRKKTERHNKKE
ncbi:AAA family ATPase [Candidatus Phytoplasma fraxini]|uniref:AAA family ATPase n=1 Tax=Ash yellows phytoplasma TaxID=35780 RepID=A0ABZ2U8K9_ASHYP